MQLIAFQIGILVTLMTSQCDGHGRLTKPASRSSAWRFGFNNPTNYNDNQLNCGGFGHQWSNRLKGKCGLCGDPYDSDRPNEAGGKFANGIIVEEYTEGQVIDVTVQITANHKGWFEFRLCENNDPSQRISQECLDRHLLQMVGGGTRYDLGTKAGDVRLQLQLPPGVTCSQCVLQWKWNAGNNWGVDKDGHGCVGCGPQEQFYGCADVSITGSRDEDFTSWPRLPIPATRNPRIQPNRNPQEDTQVRLDDESNVENERVEYHSTPGSQSTPSPGQKCQAVGIWKRIPGMDVWCTNNCQLGFCPPSYCRCT